MDGIVAGVEVSERKQERRRQELLEWMVAGAGARNIRGLGSETRGRGGGRALQLTCVDRRRDRLDRWGRVSEQEQASRTPECRRHR